MKNKFLTILIILIGLTFISCEVEPIDVIEPEVNIENKSFDILCQIDLEDKSSLSIIKDYRLESDYLVTHYSENGEEMFNTIVDSAKAYNLCENEYKTVQELYDYLYRTNDDRVAVVTYCSYSDGFGGHCTVYLQGGAAWEQCYDPYGVAEPHDDDGTGNDGNMSIYGAYQACVGHM